MSAAMARTSTPWASRIRAAVASSRSSFRATRTRLTPRLAIASANAAPSPTEPPATSAYGPYFSVKRAAVMAPTLPARRPCATTCGPGHARVGRAATVRISRLVNTLTNVDEDAPFPRAAAEHDGPMRVVSIGDSFTEGLWDRAADGALLGWADRVAMGLAAARPDEEVWYANLAVRGRLIEPIATAQLDAALALDPPPTHLTFNGGGNDMLRPGYSDERMIALLTRVLDACEAAGVHLIILSGPDPSDRLPKGQRMRELGTRLTVIVERLIEGREGVTFVDNFRDPESRRWPYWSRDRLHLNSVGHERVASRVLTALGVPTPAPVVSTDDAPRRGLVRRALGEVGYWVVYVFPWLARRLSGRSSGDRRRPKYAAWVRMPADGRAARGLRSRRSSSRRCGSRPARSPQGRCRG